MLYGEREPVLRLALALAGILDGNSSSLFNDFWSLIYNRSGLGTWHFGSAFGLGLGFGFFV